MLGAERVRGGRRPRRAGEQRAAHERLLARATHRRASGCASASHDEFPGEDGRRWPTCCCASTGRTSRAAQTDAAHGSPRHGAHHRRRIAGEPQPRAAGHARRRRRRRRRWEVPNALRAVLERARRRSRATRCSARSTWASAWSSITDEASAAAVEASASSASVDAWRLGRAVRGTGRVRITLSEDHRNENVDGRRRGTRPRCSRRGARAQDPVSSLPGRHVRDRPGARSTPGRLSEGDRHVRPYGAAARPRRSPAATRRSGSGGALGGLGPLLDRPARQRRSAAICRRSATSTPSLTGRQQRTGASRCRQDADRGAADRRRARSASSAAFRSG